MESIITFKEYSHNNNIRSYYRNILRNMYIRSKSLNRNINQSSNWIRFPFYHHVFNDEKLQFENQLKYLKNYGEFISMTDACNMISSNSIIDGRYFCLSFDDGFYNCYSNMMAITSNLDIPVIIYLPTNKIYKNFNTNSSALDLKLNKTKYEKIVPFLSWDNCLEMLKFNISFGSHTCNHINLASSSPTEIEYELAFSKSTIEANLNIVCDHFAAPWGRLNVNFDPTICSSISKKLGYKSFATTERGKMSSGDNLFTLKRDHLLANWSNYQLKYFFSND